MTLARGTHHAERLFADPKIEVLWNRSVDDILSDEHRPPSAVLRLKNLQKNMLETLEVDGVFIAIGHQPNTAPFLDFVNCDARAISTRPQAQRARPVPVFLRQVMCRTGFFRQAVTAAGTGCMAALEAERFITGES